MGKRVRIFVQGLPQFTPPEDVADLFREYGAIHLVEMVCDRYTGNPRGKAYVEMVHEEEAQAAIKALDGRAFGGRALRLSVRGSLGDPQGSNGNNEPQVLSLPFNIGIVQIAGRISLQLIQRFRDNPEELRRIDRRLFEELIAELWVGFGYEIELTGCTRDGGKDIVAVRNALVGERFLIECKRPDPGKAVGIRPVRELYAVKISEGATKAVLATTAHFSRDAIMFFEKHWWELEGKDFDGLMAWIQQYIDGRKKG